MADSFFRVVEGCVNDRERQRIVESIAAAMKSIAPAGAPVVIHGMHITINFQGSGRRTKRQALDLGRVALEVGHPNVAPLQRR